MAGSRTRKLAADPDIVHALIEQGICGRCPRYDRQELNAGVQECVGNYPGKMPQYCISG